MRKICAFGRDAFTFGYQLLKKGKLNMKKQVIPTAEMVQAAKNVLAARAEAARLRPIITAIKTQLLQSLEILNADGDRILDPKLSWLMDDKFVGIYYPALNKAYHDAGFDMPADFCPLLVAEEAEREAIRTMNGLAVQMLPVGQRFDVTKIYNLDDWHKLTGLNLAYISQFFGK